MRTVRAFAMEATETRYNGASSFDDVNEAADVVNTDTSMLAAQSHSNK